MIESSSNNSVAAGKGKPNPMARGAAAAGALTLALVAAAPAQAADGCTVLLCLAAPSWRGIDQCVPPVREVLRDLARGRPFPVCAMAGVGNEAGHAWSSPPEFCPPHYTRTVQLDAITHYECSYAGAISVVVDGTPFTRTWWNMAGDSVTEFSPAAKARLGTWDTRFDDEYAAWLATLPPPPPVNPI